MVHDLWANDNHSPNSDKQPKYHPENKDDISLKNPGWKMKLPFKKMVPFQGRHVLQECEKKSCKMFPASPSRVPVQQQTSSRQHFLRKSRTNVTLETACQMASEIWTLHWTLTLNTVFYLYMIWLTYLKQGEFGYISARIDLISSELWNSVWELGFRSCLVNAEKEAVQDTVRTYFIEHQHLHFFGLRSTCWSSIHLLIQSWIHTSGISEQSMANAIHLISVHSQHGPTSIQHIQLHLGLRS